MKLLSFDDFINESAKDEFLFESGDINLSDKFALVFVGGSIGSKPKYPVFVKGSMASIHETGNDKDELKEKATRMRKQLSPGEKKYYGMNYTVIELTSSKIKEVDYLIAQQRKSENDTEVVSESINEGSTDEIVKRSCIERLSQFFRVSPYALSHFKFDGTDNIKALTKALNSTSDQGTEAYYKVAIQVGKKDAGIE